MSLQPISLCPAPASKQAAAASAWGDILMSNKVILQVVPPASHTKTCRQIFPRSKRPNSLGKKKLFTNLRHFRGERGSISTCCDAVCQEIESNSILYHRFFLLIKKANFLKGMLLQPTGGPIFQKSLQTWCSFPHAVGFRTGEDNLF